MRLNTVFKFYYQAWVLFGVSGLFGLSYLWLAAQEGGRKLVPAGVTVVYAALFIGTLLFPYFGVQSRAIEFRGPVESANRLPATLNGLAQTATFNPDEYAAIMWLRDNVDGTPTIVEAVGGQYSAYGRISASTGIPTLLGWAGHQYQWRGYSTPEPAERDQSRSSSPSTSWPVGLQGLLINNAFKPRPSSSRLSRSSGAR